MGWWKSDPHTGGITQSSETVWGDTPADLMSQLVDAFVEETGRVPSVQEIVAGYNFTIGGMKMLRLPNPKDDPWALDVPEDVQVEVLKVMDADVDVCSS